jgi:8-oxo-dGTP pyrophosphatase MutT (NUDIX family)
VVTEASSASAATPPEPASFHDSLPRKLIAAGMLLFNIDGQVLLVEPTYKPRWDLPGGVVEADESPRDAAQREITEELGLDCAAGRLLVLDWVAPAADRPEGVITVFEGKVLSAPEVARIVVPPEELHGFGFFDLSEVGSVLPPILARRMTAAVQAYRDNTTVYLEDGYLIT